MKQITLSDVTIAYDGKERLKNVDFSIKSGEYVCIIGENGAGKTTLVKSILGLKAPESGEIMFDGITHRDIGYLPQQTNVQRNFPASVKEIVMTGFLNRKHCIFYSRAEYDKAVKILEKLGIGNLFCECYRNLSGGQQQRVLLARALCAASKAVVLDEPTASLDPAAAEEFYSLISEINKKEKLTVIAVTHDISAAKRFADSVVYLKNDTARLYKTSDFFCGEGDNSI